MSGVGSSFGLPLLTASQMRAADAYAITQEDMPGAMLMETAGRSCVAVLEEYLPSQPVVVVAGAGNNGADGHVIARVLHERGREVFLALVGDPGKMSSDGRAHRERMIRSGASHEVISHLGDIGPLQDALNTGGEVVVVDALLGTGLSAAPRPLASRAIGLMNRAKASVLAVDLPSGLNGSTGAREGAEAVSADHTVALGASKVGHLMGQGRAHVGVLHVAEIGISRAAVQSCEPRLWWGGPGPLDELPERGLHTHKGRQGKVLIIGGSMATPGAAGLAAEAALDGGAALVCLAAPEGALDQLRSISPEVMRLRLPGIALEDAHLEALRGRLEWADALCIGPGMGKAAGGHQLVDRILKAFDGPVLLDAEALHSGLNPHGSPADRLITPHPGEAATLLGLAGGAEVETDRLAAARMLSRRLGVACLLKGANSLITMDGTDIWVNPNGTSLLAVGGSGDVLSGFVAALMARGLLPAPAARAGAWVHAEAARIAATAGWVRAGQISSCLPDAAVLGHGHEVFRRV